MGETGHIDYIKRIVDDDNENLILLTFSEQNVIMFRHQFNILDSFPMPEFKFLSFKIIKLNNPTPCQYAVIVDKRNSLKGLINFLCNQKDYYKCFGLPQFEKGLKLEIESVFCPTVSNTTWPLLHLAVGLGRFKILTILVDFLREQDQLANFINKPDIEYRTPLSIAFATGIDDIIDYLLENGANPYYNQNESIMPLIFTCMHYSEKLPKAIECIKKHENIYDFPVFEPLEKFFYDNAGFAYSEQKDGTQKFVNFLRDVSVESTEIYFYEQQGPDPIKILDIEKVENTNNYNNNDNANSDACEQRCCVHDCDSSDLKLCFTCQKCFCAYHFDDEKYHNHNE